MRLAVLIAAVCASPLAAQDDGFEKADPSFAPFRDAVAIGDLLSDALPAADASSSGCMVNFTMRAMVPELGVPVTLTSTADVSALDFEQWQPDVREEQITAMIPTGGTAFIHMSLTSDDTDARAAFTARLPAKCTEMGCDATLPAPGFAFTVFNGPLSKAQAARDALQTFAETCSEAG